MVVKFKMDGENTTIYDDGFVHARSMDSTDHPSRHWMKSFAWVVAYGIHAGFRICGENLYAKHSIHYENLPSYFLAFSAWEGERCLSWHTTEALCGKLGIETVPVVYIGEWDSDSGMERLLLKCFEPYETDHEGYVVRPYDSFDLKDFCRSVAKYVRQNHVQTEKHWMHEKIIKNGLR